MTRDPDRIRSVFDRNDIGRVPIVRALDPSERVDVGRGFAPFILALSRSRRKTHIARCARLLVSIVSDVGPAATFRKEIATSRKIRASSRTLYLEMLEDVIRAKRRYDRNLPDVSDSHGIGQCADWQHCGEGCRYRIVTNSDDPNDCDSYTPPDRFLENLDEIEQ